MAKILATAAATATLLSTLGKVINEVTGDLKSDCQRLERHVRSMDEFYYVHKHDPVYRDKDLETALETETVLVNKTDERLKKMTSQRKKGQGLKNFLKESEGDLRKSSQAMNKLLKRIDTRALIQIADQGQNDPIPETAKADGPQASTHIKGASSASAYEDSSTQPANEDDSKYKVHKVKKWLENVATEEGIYIPNKDVMLLRFDLKKDVLKEMVKDLGSNSPSESYFNKVWRENFPKYKVSQDEKEIKVKNHHPTNGHTTVTITTLNPSNYNLPQLVKREDTTNDLAKLNVRLTGGLFEDGSEPKPHIFRDLNYVPHDTNFIINCLLNLLVHHKGELRKSLLLQLHWDQSEMKKNILLSFVFLLVDRNIFREIYVRFLPQTPIIAAVRRIFPHINQQLSEGNIPYIDDLDRTIRDTRIEDFKEVRAEEVKYVFDVERWILPYFGEWPVDADNHMWFRFCKKGGTTFMYSRSSLDDPWPDTARFKQTIPTTTSIPGWVRSSLSAAVDVDALEEDISDKYSSKLSLKNCQNWKSFLSSLDTYDQVPASPESWPLQDLMTGEQ